MINLLHRISRRILLPSDSLRLVLSIFVGLAATLAAGARAAEAPRTFSTPEDAVASLAAAAQARDREALQSLFGSAVAEIQNPDRVQATNEFAAFSAAFEESHRLVSESDTKRVLEVGANHWPFPIPLVRQGGSWSFDTAAGAEELLNRRIGRNELEVLKACRAFVDAEREYASRDHDGDTVLEFSQRLASSPGTRNGLFWETEEDGELSPLGPLVAEAQVEGYRMASRAGSGDREPFHGYFFKILTRQGRNAAGGSYDYIINGNMIGGFALLAWPAEYGQSGVMSFIVNQQGRVYQRDLGKKTSRSARRMKSYDPDSGWAISPD